MRLLSNENILQALVSEETAKSYPRPNHDGALLVFTPRSGSSWLSDLLRSTGLVGDPQEYLNQDLLPIATQRFPARTETDYLNAVETLSASPDGQYCIAATWGQIDLCAHDLLARYQDRTIIYLRRRDILAQAVSLYLAVTSGRFHVRGPDVDPSITEWSADVASTIARWWAHILNYECLTDIQFAVRDIVPLRLYYEDIVMDAHGTVRRILDACGVSDEPTDIGTWRSAVGNDDNRKLQACFMAEHGALAAMLNRCRPPLT